MTTNNMLSKPLRTIRNYIGVTALAAAASLLSQSPSQAHPHVFVDGGVDFVINEQRTLEALEVTWLIDEFETLYILSDYGLSLNKNGILDDADRRELIETVSDWPEDFEGAAHLSVEDKDIALDFPTNLEARIKNGRLYLKFTRKLTNPINIKNKDVEIGFYDSTYYYAYFVRNEPKVIGDQNGCELSVTPFDPDMQLAALQTTLSRVGREEDTGIADIGALFADRINLRCE